jgi:hypothetical protein
MEEGLLSKHEDLSSNPSIAKIMTIIISEMLFCLICVLSILSLAMF